MNFVTCHYSRHVLKLFKFVRFCDRLILLKRTSIVSLINSTVLENVRLSTVFDDFLLSSRCKMVN